MTGAAHIYASNEEWKHVVKRELDAARLVIIRAGERESLFWELKEAVDTLTPQKVILVLDMKLRHYECFRANVDRVLQISLPSGAVLWRPRLRFISGFLAFSPG